METILNYIGGQHVEAQSGDSLEVYDPSCAQVYAKAPRSGGGDVEAAIQAAEAALPAWSSLSGDERASHLDRLSRLIEERLEDLAIGESRDNGKPLALARSVDIPRSAANLRFFAAMARSFASESHPSSSTINFTRRDPLGVVACISPWNLPLYLFTWKIAPALAAGNTVVAKPSEVTPYTAYQLGRLCEEAGLPAGVLNIVHGFGPEVGAPLCEHPKVKAVSFTGGTATGKAIAQSLAPQFKKLSLELGGKNPNIIFADCDFDEAVETTLRSSFSNQGQICLCGSRVFVEASIYERFRDALLAKVAKLRQGDPMDEATQQGALVSKAHFDKVASAIQRAVDEGGRILCGGRAPKLSGRCAEGWFMEPTVIEGLDASCVSNQEEIFGPVVSLMAFDQESEVLAAANSTPYGLAASIWTKDLDRAHRLAEKLESGIVWVNTWMNRDLRTPFGGVKQSGLGREGGLEAMRFFTETKNICIQYR